MKRKLIGVFFALTLLTGCASSPLDLVSSVVGSKPDMTAQVGAENTKQAVGITSKVDASSQAEATVKDSKVGSLDSSSNKKVTASSITADMIKADTIQISNNDSGNIWLWVGFASLLSLSAGALIGRKFGVKKGA